MPSYYSTIKLAIAVCLVVSIPICSLGQKKSTAIGSSEPKRPQETYQPNYATGPFDNHISKLPPVYEGHDLAEAYHRIVGLAVKKSEFETTDEYRARVRSTVGDQLYAFEATVPLGSPFSYDADRQVFVVRVPSDYLSTVDVCKVSRDMKLSGRFQIAVVAPNVGKRRPVGRLMDDLRRSVMATTNGPISKGLVEP
jgi:hypothetical protein